MSTQNAQRQVTLSTLGALKRRGEKFASLTAYDAIFAGLVSGAGVKVILVGDSLGMVLQGHDSTLPVTVEDIAYHLGCVKRGNQGALIMADLPFMSYASEGQSLESAAHLMRSGAHMVKLEGGAWLAESTRLLTERGIPVCAHMGLTPQSINRIGGYRVQGRNPDQAATILGEAKLLEDSGAAVLLLECVPVDLAAKLTEEISVPVIGIGAGPATDGQIMVLHDLLGMETTGVKPPRFVKNFLTENGSIQGAVAEYVRAVESGDFPAPEHCFS